VEGYCIASVMEYKERNKNKNKQEMEKMDNETRQRNTYLGQQWSEGVEG
jgi:hypothetical protein